LIILGCKYREFQW